MNGLLHSRFAETLGWTLVHSLWQLAVLAGLWAAGLALLRRASAGVRYVWACAGLALMLAAPVVTYARLLPPARASVATGYADIIAVTAIVGHGDGTRTAASAVPAASVSLPVRVRLALAPGLPWAVGCYVLGMGVMFVRMLLGYARLRGILRRGTALQGRVAAVVHELARRLQVRRSIGILQSAAIEVPTLVGALKPVILLPASALTGLSADQLTALLAHEIAHIRRHDYLANLVQSLIETLLFYHPAAWWLSARIRQERELCCDDAAVEATSDRLAYARALASMESLRVPTNLAPAAGGGSLVGRIRHILHATPTPARAPRRFVTTGAAAIFVGVLTVLAYIGCNQTNSAPAAPLTIMPALDANSHTFDIRYLLPADAGAGQKQKAVRDLVADLQAAIAPDSWKARGGAGEITEADGRLTVTQSPENGRAVNTWLREQFEARAAAMDLECRVLLLSPSLVDDIRVGWQDGAPVQGPAGTQPGYKGTVLDDWTRNIVLKMAQEDPQTVVLTAPAVTAPEGYSFSVDVLPEEKSGVATRVAPRDFAGLHVAMTLAQEQREIVMSQVVLAPISNAPTASAAPARFNAALIPGGTFLVDGGPVPAAEGKSGYRLWILLRPHRCATAKERRQVFVSAAGGMREPEPAASATEPSPSTDSNIRQVLLKVLFAEMDAEVFSTLTPGGATQPAEMVFDSDLSQAMRKLADGKNVELIARPYVLTQDGQEAFVMIGQQVPFVRGYYTDPEKGRVPAVGYRDVGIRFDVLPRLSPDQASYMLDIDASLSAVSNVPPAPDPATGLPPLGAPLLYERSVKASVKVANGKTVALLLKPVQSGKVNVVFVTPHRALSPDAEGMRISTPAAPESRAADPLP
jgi:beta-lactamase regulating signal transducer with metallopeptidase domain